MIRCSCRARPERAALALVVSLAIVAAAPAAGWAQSVRDDFYVTNGQVNAQVLRGNTLYVGGSFSFVGPLTGTGLPVDTTSGAAIGGFPHINGTVLAAIPDGAGGWYVGGQFTAVDGFARSNLVHVLADNSVSSWNPGANGAVRALLANAGQLIVGGDFTTLGGQTRNRIGSVDLVTGSLASWNPNANSTVRQLALDGSWAIAGGAFTSIGGATRNRIAEVDLSTGLARSTWDPNANSTVLALRSDGTTLYLGGQFTTVGGQTRNRAAAVSLATGAALSWNPNASSQVNAIVVDGGTVYAGGLFTSIGGQTRNRIAALGAGSGLATAWNPNASGTVQTMELAGGALYVGGDFLTIGGQSRSRAAALSPVTGLATAWNPSAFSTVNVVAPGDSRVFVGGSFTALGGVARGNLAAFDVTTGVVTGWNPSANGQVQALLATPDVIYAGGNFTQIGDQIRNGAAALDLTNGLPTEWNPNVGGQVSALAAANGNVYIGGFFASVGAAARSNLAAVEAASGLPTSWAPEADDQVFDIKVGASAIYVGGNFDNVGGEARGFIAALDPATGAATAWDPSASGTVRSIALACDRAYVGGFFTSIGGQMRNFLATLDLATGQALPWAPNANGPVLAVAPASGVVYIGGIMNSIGGVARNRVASLDPQTGVPTSWNPNSNGAVRSVVTGGGEVYVGGLFTALGSSASGNLAAVSADVSLPCPAIALTPPPLAPAVVGNAYSATIAAAGGSGPYCFRVSAGSLPAGLSLGATSGQIAGTPAAAGTFVFTIAATDVHGCFGEASYTLDVTSASAVTSVAPTTLGLCLNPAQVCVTVPFVLARGESTPLRALSVTFHIEATKLARCAAGAAAASIHPGDWASAFPNLSFQVLDNGGGSYTVDQVVLGAPCGITNGGTVFNVDLKSAGVDGAGAVTVTSVTARDCDNAPVAVAPGAGGSVNITSTAILLSPATLPGAVAGVPYGQTLSASAGTPPLTFAVTAGAAPPGLTLAAGGQLAGTPALAGSFAFTVTATDANGCKGSRAYSIAVTCPAIALTPSLLPDGAVGVSYSQALSASPAVAPLTFGVSAGSLPPGLALSPAGVLSGVPTAAGPVVVTLAVTDAAGCSGSRSYVWDVFASPPVSSVAANAAGLCISSEDPCVSVPFVYTRGESTAARGVKVSFQIDPAMLALCTPLHPDSSIALGSWFAGYANGTRAVTDDGGGAYTVDVVLLGAPCGITAGGTLFTANLKSIAGDGLGTITVTSVKSRDCDNQAIPVMAGPQATLHVMHAPIPIAPPVLPNGLIGQLYSQTLTAGAGDAPFAFTVSAGVLPPGLALSAGGVLSGTPSATGAFAFTAHVRDAGGCPGSRAYTMTVSCPLMAVLPATLPDAQVGAAYSQTLTVSGGLSPVTWSVSAGSLPPGLVLSPTGEISGTPTAPGTGAFDATATHASGCAGTGTFLLSAFTDPYASSVAASSAGLCISSARPCVSVPFVYTRGESAAALGASVTFRIDTARFSLCTPATPASSIHAGSWLAGYANASLFVTDLGGGRYTVDQALLGAPCGPTTGGVLFSADLQAAGPDGVGDIEVTAVHVRDCDNAALPAVPGPAAQLVVTHAAPPAIADLAAAQVSSGNGSGGTTGIALAWTAPVPGAVSVYRAPFGAYPEYDDGGGTAPDSSAAPGAPWSLVSASAAPGLVDHPPARGFWHYVAFLTDSCGNRSAVSNRSAGALNYHLGDVSNGLAAGVGDNRVGLEDFSLLGAHYGISGSTLVTDGVAYLDVGPTTDGSLTSRPVTDDAIDFEDLMVFAGNFHVVSAPQMAALPPALPHGVAGREAFAVEAPSLVSPGEILTARLRLAAAGRMQGFSVLLAWDPGVVRPEGSTSAGWIESQMGAVLFPRPGTVDAALLGRRRPGIEGENEVASVTFRALREGDAAIRIERIFARDADNRPLDPEALERESRAADPSRTLLLPPTPNPAPGAATLSFALARAGTARLSIYAVDGRCVRTLASGVRAAGLHHIEWSGDDNARRPLPPGIYWVRLEAAGLRFTRRMALLR